MKLWLLRHAPVIAPAGTCYGATDYAAEMQATLIAATKAAALLPHLPQLSQLTQCMAFYSSPLQRCTVLANELLQLRPDLRPLQLDARLAEMDFGVWEGSKWDAIPRSAFDAWMADFGQHRFGESESTQGFIDRVAAFVQQLQAQGITQAVCVCHAGTIRALHYLAAHGLRPIAAAAEWPALTIELGSCCEVDLSIN